MVVSCQSKRPTILPCASEVGMAQGIPATVQSGTLAVPDPHSTIKTGIRKLLENLTAHHGRKGKFLIYSREKMDSVL